LYLGDCRHILPTLPKVDAVVTDPPYGISYNRETEPQEKHVQSHRMQIAQVIGDDEPFDPTPVLAVGKAHILWGANCYASRLPDSPAWLAWDKVTRNNLALRISEVELAWTNCVGRPAIHRFMWSGAYRDAERGENYHPTQKPVSLMSWCLTRPGVPDGLVLDPYMGSGPTGIACTNLGRKFIGIEIDRKYFDIACERIAAAYAQQRLFA
jgi:site-specific DNA-methyltransferase (adenine-specific)